MNGINFLSSYSRRSVSDYGCRYLLFFVTFCLYAIGMLVGIHAYTEEGNSMGIIVLTVIGFALSILVFCRDRWQDSRVHLYPLFWHITVIYCFGFLGTIYFLQLLEDQNDISSFIGLLGIGFAILVLGQLVDRRVFLVGLVVSTMLGIILYNLGLYNGESSMYAMLAAQKTIINILTLVVVVGSVLLVLFCTGGSKPDVSYLDSLLSIFSRELTHHIGNVVSNGKSHGSMISMCIQSSKITKSEKEDQVTMSMTKNVFYTLEESLSHLSDTHDRGQAIMRSRISAFGCSKIKKDNFGYYSVNDCIRDALLDHENLNDLQYKLPSVHIKQDFTFFGSHLHFKQIIIHLLTYSYWRCRKEDDDRHIWVKDNKIHYYYTSLRIKTSEMLDLFSYPTNPDAYLANSEGLGEIGMLYHVRKVMESFGGDVICKSNVKKGVRYTHFILSFPKVNTNDKTTDNKSNITAKQSEDKRG